MKLSSLIRQTAAYLRSGSSATSQLQRQYGLALGLIVCLSVSNHLLLQHALRLEQQQALVVDVFRDQQLVGLRLTQAAVAIELADSDDALQRAAVELHAAKDRWRRSTAALKQQGWIHDNQPGDLASRQAEALLALAADGTIASLPRARVKPTVACLVNEESQFLERLQALLAARERELAARRARLQTAGVALVIVTLLVIGAQALLIFGRAVRLLRRLFEQERLLEDNAELLQTFFTETLRESEDQSRKLGLVAQNTINLVAICDSDGKIEWINDSFQRITGIHPHEAIGKTLGHLLKDTATDRRAVDAVFDKLRKGHSVKAELTLFGRDGNRHILATDGQCCFNEEGVAACILIGADVTEQHQANLALAELSRQNELILNSVVEGLCGIDRQGRVVLTNPSALRLLGRASSDVIGRHHHEALGHRQADGRLYPLAECPICLALWAGQSYRSDREFFGRDELNCFPVDCAAVPIHDPAAPLGFVITFSDITQRNFLQRQLLQAQKLESIGQLAAGVAHEINTPIQYVRDNTCFLQDAFRELKAVCDVARELVADGPAPDFAGARSVVGHTDFAYLDEEVPAALEQSLEGIDRVTKIVRAMKEFSHPSHDRMSATDLNRAIDSTITVARNEWKYVADLVTDFDPYLPPLQCIADEFNQVILNLIVNAAHAIGDVVAGGRAGKGTITVSTRALDECVEIRVADTGGGIPEECREKIFNPFFTTKPVGKGTGQGLALAHRVIVEKHGGTLDFETQTGVGTTFIIRLPLGNEATNEGEHDETVHFVC